jgi:phage/plasmid-like protein (TIGR03299 family)
MFSVRVTPWHGLGAVLDRPPATISEAIEASGLGWNVAKEPIAIDRGETSVADWSAARCEEIPGFYATVRQDTREVLGIVGERYRIVQNHEAFAFVDQLLGSSINFETAGSLHGGRRVWVLATLPDHVEVGGDVVRPYVLLMNSHDGSTAVIAATTPIRVVTGEMRISVWPELGSTRGLWIWGLGSGSGMSRLGCRCLASEPARPFS